MTMINGNVAAITVAGLITAAVVVLSDVGKHPKSSDQTLPGMSAECVHVKEDRFELPSYRPSQEERRMMNDAIAGIIEAYTNGQTKVLHERVQNVPVVMTNIMDSAYLEIVSPLMRIFDRTFLTDPRCYVDGVVGGEEALRLHLESNIEIALFLGGMELSRGAGSGYLILIDRGVTRRLRRYSDKFHQDGNRECEAILQQYIKGWCEHLESRDGFTRRYMWHQAELQSSNVKSGKASWEQLSKLVKGFAQGLNADGYTPMWLVEFSGEALEKHFTK